MHVDCPKCKVRCRFKCRAKVLSVEKRKTVPVDVYVCERCGRVYHRRLVEA